MHTGLSTIHEMSQKRLNGMPRSMGSTRSQSGTEKQMAAKGINASRIAAGAGPFSSFRQGH